MSNITFPLRGERLTLGRAFATEEQLHTLGPENWLSFMANYETAGDPIRVVAPTDGFIRIISKETVSGAEVPLLEFRPRAAGFVYRVPGWAMPVPNRFLFSSSALDTTAAQNQVIRDALEAEARRQEREELRLCLANFDGDMPTGCDPLTISRTVTSEQVDLIRRLGSSVIVPQGQELATLSNRVSMGMAHLQDFRDRHPRWYWFDAHELFKRIRAADPRDRDLEFPFTEDPAGGLFKIWYENHDRLAISGDVQIKRLEGGLQQTAIYQPPVENAADRERSNPEREVVPGALCLQMEGRPVRVVFSATGVSFQLLLINALGEDRIIHRSRDFNPSADEEGGDFEILRSTYGYSFPETRLDPYLIVLLAGDRSLSFTLQNSLMQRVSTLAQDLIDSKLSMIDWLQSDGNSAKVQIFNKLELFFRETGGDGSPLRSRLNTSRYEAFLLEYRGRQHRLEQAVTALTAALSPAFFDELQANPSEGNFDILNLAIDALADTDGGDTFLEESFRGFLLPELRSSGSPLIPFEFITGVWNSAMQFRSKAVESLLLIAKVDMYLAVRELYTVPLTVNRAARLTALVGRFEERFGEMHHLRVVTGEFEVAGMRMQNFHFEWDTAALEGEDLPSQRHQDRTLAGNAEVAARTLNTINLLSSIYSILAQCLAIYHRDRSEISWSDIYELTENMVGVADAIADIIPSRTRIAARPGWGAISSGVGLIFSAVSLSKVLQDALSARSRGDYAMGNWLVVSAAGSAVSLGAGGLAFLGAASGPLAPLVIAGSLVALWAGIIAGVSAGSALELDLDHCYFGRYYDNLVRNYDAIPAADREPEDLAELVERNRYFPWVRNLITHLGHLNNHLFPLNGRLRVDALGSGAGYRVRINTTQSYCAEYSRVYFVLFSDGTPDQFTEGTFVLSPASLSGRVTKAAEPMTGPDFAYRASRTTTGRMDIEIEIILPRAVGLDNVDRAILTVTHQPSMEYVAEASDTFLGYNISALRRDPHNVYGGSEVIKVANKSTQFLTTT